MPSEQDALIDVLLVNYNSTPFLCQCLASLNLQEPQGRLRLMVRDNASEDRAEAVKGMPGVQLTQGEENVGFSRGINSLARQGRAPYLLLLNPDCILQDGFFSQALEYMDVHPRVGALGPRVLDSNGSLQGSARRFPSVLTGLFGRSTFLSRLLPDNAATRREVLTAAGPQDQPFPCDWVSGACMLVRREAFDQVGGMDEDYFLFWEDADLCARLRRGNWEVVYHPGPAVVHQVGGSRRSNMARSIWHFHRSALLWLKKNGSRRQRLLQPLWALLLGARLVAVMSIHLLRQARLNLSSGRPAGK